MLAALLLAPTALVSATEPEPAESVRIAVLSNRADVLSGGNALLEIELPSNAAANGLNVSVGSNDVSSAFAVRADGRVTGRIEGLSVGDNIVTAQLPDGRGASITLTNHPIGGPVFSGPQLQPWVCTTASNGLGAPVDGQCNAPTVIQYFYRSTSSTSFAAYDPANPPSNVANVTTDQGKTVPYIIRQETGTQNRGIYRVAVLYDPAKPFEPWNNGQQGWNHKLYYPFGASCGTQYTQGSAQNVQDANALGRGFMVATSSLNVTGSNCNTVLQAESVMMLKEHIVERYGEIRYTFGTGSSGGAIGQHMVANAYPGLLQGLTVGSAYADTITTGAEVFDCHNLINYFTRTSPHLWANPAQQSLVAGHGTSPGTCAGWEALFSSNLNPRTGCGPVPASQVYHESSNPSGVRCAYQDYEQNVWGLRPQSMWTPPEQAAGRGFAHHIYGNVGIQYGLLPLQQGQITTEQFVDLNEKIGSFDLDFYFTKERSTAGPGTAATAYRSGRITDGANLGDVAIIDSRGIGNIDPLLIHTMHHSFALKERLRRIHGHADNHAVWRGGSPASAFDVMDRWLTAVENDTSNRPRAEKVVANKPAEAQDMCFAAGQRITDKATCDTVWPYYGAPRTAAGASVAHDVFECTRRPLNRSDDYGPIPFTDSQWDRLEAAFSSGVCDYAAPGAGQENRTVAWLTYAAGPGTGTPLGAAPVSNPL